MTASKTIDNLDLAENARDIADGAPAGSVERAAAGSVAVSCATTRNTTDARSVLNGVTPDNVRKAAIELFSRLSGD